ncbi:helix-turn-helix domain-containing protein [Pantoea agglomerans]
MKPKYSTQFKLKVVRYFLDGYAGLGGTAQHFGISRTHAIRWIQLYLHHGEEALRTRRWYNVKALRHLWRPHHINLP